MDTVIIKIYGPHKFQFKNKALFLPEITSRKYNELSTTEKQTRNSSRNYLRKFVLHPKYNRDYVPNVEVFETLAKDQDKVIYVLKITLSAPKMLYWNSLQEVSESHKDRVFSTLKSSLGSVGILVEIKDIANATVASVHACKNIPLPKKIRMREIINELSKIDVNKSFDVTDNKCKKGSRVLNIYSGTIDWSIYDKISDSLRPKNKRNDKYHIDYERKFIEQHNLEDREVFRYEYRIKKTQTVKREINALLKRDYQTPVIFTDLFRPNILKSLVLNSWQSLIDKPANQLSLFGKTDKLGLFLHILSEAKKRGENAYSMNTAFTSYGIAIAIQEHGAKEFRGAINDVWNKDHPERLTRKIKVASELTKGLPSSNNIAFIDKELKKFEIISLASIQRGI